jgi:chaperonin cofactor prefoldin
MSGIENGGNGERDDDFEADLKLDLSEIEAMLKDLETMLPAVHEDVAHIHANIERVREQLALFDARAEEMRESGELSEDMEVARSIGKAMNDIEAGLQRLIEDKDIVLSTRMSIENAIVDLKDTREELESGLPEKKIQ